MRSATATAQRTSPTGPSATTQPPASTDTPRFSCPASPGGRTAQRPGSTRLHSRLPEPLSGLGLPVTIPRAFSRCCRSHSLHIAADAALLLRVTSLARCKGLPKGVLAPPARAGAHPKKLLKQLQ